MLRRLTRYLARILKYALILGLIGLLVPRLITALHAWTRLYRVDDVPPQRVAIVFGAGLRRDGTPTPVLRDRVATAAELYFAGKIEKLLMSGDNRVMEYNEPGAMRDYALSLGVPSQAIVLDYAGRSTYDTCYRAREIFGVRQAILVTQRFHLPRSLYICSALGMETTGVPADRRFYWPSALFFWNMRELPATLNALLEVHLLRPLPVLGNPEPIFPLEAQ